MRHRNPRKNQKTRRTIPAPKVKAATLSRTEHDFQTLSGQNIGMEERPETAWPRTQDFLKMKILLMKKSLWIPAVALFVISSSVHEDSLAATSESMQAGVAASVKGEVKATTPPERTSHLLKDGDKIFMGDKIETGAEGQLQILLLDQTFFTLGPLSTIMVDEFIYDPGNAGAKASVVKGILRAVSSKMTQKNQEDVPGDSSSGTVKADSGTPLPGVQDDGSALAELGNAIDAVDTPTPRANNSSEDQRQPA
jgi:hypothetical protein